MKLRLDLLEHLTAEDILQEVLANNHRYKPEPNFSKTGVGSLSSASIEERAQEEARSTALIKKLKSRAQASGRESKNKSFRSIYIFGPPIFLAMSASYLSYWRLVTWNLLYM